MAQKGEVSLLKEPQGTGKQEEKGSWPGTLGTRNVKPPEDLPHGLRT